MKFTFDMEPYVTQAVRQVEPEVDFVPPSSYFVSQRGWGRRFTSRPAALEHVDFLLGDGGFE